MAATRSSIMLRPQLFSLARQAFPLFLSSRQPCYVMLFNDNRQVPKVSAVNLQSHGGARRFTAGRFVTRAADVNDAGSIDSPLMLSMQNKIKGELNAESVSVKDAYGDGRHVSIDVVSAAFEGQSAVNRQRMVYKAIWEELQNIVHAVDQMTTLTPDEAAAKK